MIDGNAVPGLVLEGLKAYVDTGRPVGGFLRAVLRNDLIGAAKLADDTNRAALGDIAVWVYWNVPTDAMGSLERIQAWSAHRGKSGAPPVATA